MDQSRGIPRNQNHEAHLKQVLLLNVQILEIVCGLVKLMVPFQIYCSNNFLLLNDILSKLRKGKTLILFIQKNLRKQAPFRSKQWPKLHSLF